jgi:hypothetical protein
MRHIAKKNFMDLAKELSLEHLQPFLEGLRKNVMPLVPTDDPKLHKMFVDTENKIYGIMKKLHDESTLMAVNNEASKTSTKAAALKAIWAKKKKALDAVNEELGKPTYEPRKDFDRNDSPFYSKGTETNLVAPDPPHDPKVGAFEQMPKLFNDSIKELCRVAMNNGYARVVATPAKVNFKKRIEDSGYDYDVEYKKTPEGWKMQGGEVRTKYEFAPDIEMFVRRLKSADIKQHPAPEKLPPRDDIRTHMDQEVKKEIQNDPDLKKEARRSMRRK